MHVLCASKPILFMQFFFSLSIEQYTSCKNRPKTMAGNKQLARSATTLGICPISLSSQHVRPGPPLFLLVRWGSSIRF